MAKKGELTGIHYILIAATTMILIIGGYYFISLVLKSSEKTQLANLRLSMENSFKEYGTGFTGAPGSAKDVSFSVPEGVERICFVGGGERNQFLDEQLETYLKEVPNKNVFFFPFEKFEASFVDFFELEDTPLCIIPRGGAISLHLVSTGSGVKVQAKEGREIGCSSLRYSRDYGKAVDIVFVGSGYNDDSLAADSESYIATFLSVEPFKSKQDLFNFFIAEGDAECKIGDFVSCDHFQASRIASKCPNDFMVVLVSRDNVLNVLNPVRSSAMTNLLSLNTADNRMVFVHEFGHGFSNLADEYTDDAFYQKSGFKAEEYPNCDAEDCGKWKGKLGTGCFGGCSLSSYYRSTEDSIMRSLKSKDFGPVNEEVLRSYLEVYE
ncbi:MAG TPA: M64 family metallopeptidase [Candidatus Nanoarchaeia archaeon]|nr:M64 family metallopeptidase [Candidatus Nanoarchaeia archaeon]